MVTSNTTNYMFLENNWDMSYLTLGTCNISINLKTGNVTIPENLTLDEASKEFWKAIQKHFPVK